MSNVMSNAKEVESEADRLISQKLYEFDDILKMVGGFGRYTFGLYVFMCVMSIPIGLQQLVQVFYGATPKLTCVAFTQPSNASCPGCCDHCVKYEFENGLTSAVTEVIRDI